MNVPSEPRPTEDPAVPTERESAWAARVQRLEGELARTRRAMRTRAVIEQAKGFLAATLSCTPDAAFAHLNRLSQHENRRVIEVAARLIGAALPDDPGAQADEPAGAPHRLDPTRYAPAEPAPLAGREPVSPGTLPAELRVRLSTAVAALDSAGTVAELAQRVLDEGAGWLSVDSVAIYLLEPDGALRMVGQAGLPAQVASDWRHIPSAVDVPLRQAVTADQPRYRSGKEPAATGPSWLTDQRARASLPLHAGDRPVGGIGLAWSGPRDLSPAEQRYLAALAGHVERRLADVLEDPADLAPSVHWLGAALDATPAAVMLLSPVRVDGEVVDFVIDYLSPVAAERFGDPVADVVGRRLLDYRPALALGEVFDGYREVVRGGLAWHRPAAPETVLVGERPRQVLLSHRATRLGDGVLVAWEAHDTEVQAARLERIEAFGAIGYLDWQLATDEQFWSPGLYRLLSRSPERGPVPLSQLAEQVPADDLPRLRAAVTDLVERGDPADQLVRLRTGGGIRLLRVRAALGTGPSRTVLALVEDLTEPVAQWDKLVRADRGAALRRIHQGGSQR